MTEPTLNPRWVADDLDRCVHGRHADDDCFGCPGGHSTGNLCLQPGTVIGHTLFGAEIRVPAWWRRAA